MDRLHQIKYKRMKPEERFLYDLLVQAKPKISDEFPNSIFYTLDDLILFEYNQKNSKLWCNHDIIWLVFERKFNINDIDIQFIIKKMVEDILNLRDKISFIGHFSHRYKVGDTLNLRNITPILPYLA